MNFHDFKAPVRAQFERMSKHDLFCVDISGDELWQHYLASFPAGTNPIYRERTVHDCSCCRQFVKTLGGVVAIIDGNVETVWESAFVDYNELPYEIVADKMAALVASRPIDRPFLHYEKHVGTDKNYDDKDGSIREFHHFYAEIPFARNQGKNFVCPGKDIPTRIGEARSTHDVFKRSLETLTQDSLDTVLELVANQSLYRGEEQKFVLTEFSKLKTAFVNLPPEKRDLFVWANYDKVPASVARIRNTAIGTLLVDLSEGLDLEDVVRKFETSVMAPSNYKRPTALVSKAMVEKARKAVSELGIEDALERRHARLSDMKVTDILFADRAARKAMDDVFDTVPTRPISHAKALDKVETVGIDQFVREILPRIEQLEVMLENKHTGNLVSLIAPQHKTSRPIFKWGNGFSWTYNGEVTDSIKERVKRAGGNVTGDLCCRLSWSNYDDLDLHMLEPSGHEISFRNKGPSMCGGQLDVDMNAGGGRTREPVENIFYSNRRRMYDGRYVLFVHQFAKRETDNVGFEVEIDWLGDVRRFCYDKPVRQGERIDVARMQMGPAGFEIEGLLPSTQSSKIAWGLKTQEFHSVTTMMLSPNYWGEGNGAGNKHFFFMLDGCINDERPRGFFNEFLIDELTPHRKVIEIVGSKSKVEPSSDQLSGLGFSSTQRNELLVRARGSFTRTLKVQF